MTRIRLTKDVPVGKEHGCFKGKEFVVTRFEEGRGAKTFFIAESGAEVGVFSHQFEIIHNEEGGK